MTSSPRLGFLFTGQGAQYAGMGRQLYRTSSRFRSTLDRCASAFDSELPEPLLTVMFDEDDARLKQTIFAQPALFSLEVALLDVLAHWGVKPDLVLGHSLGEIVAATAAGAFDLKTAIQLVVKRCSLMQSLPQNGRMAVVAGDEGRIRDVIEPFSKSVAIAALNGPANVVVSGAEADLDLILERLRSDGLNTTQLSVSHAFHSPLMEPILAPFRAAIANIDVRPLRLGLVSNRTGELCPAGRKLDADYWAAQLREPVCFERGGRTLASHCSVFVEVGPHPILSDLMRDGSAAKDSTFVATLRKNHDAWETLVSLMTQLCLCGVNVDWAAFSRDYQERPLEEVTAPMTPGVPAEHAQQSLVTKSDQVTETLSRLQRHAEGIFEDCVIEEWRTLAEMGFNSLRLLQLAVRLSSDPFFGGEISGTDLMQYATLEELASALAERGTEADKTHQTVVGDSIFHGALAVPALAFLGEYGLTDKWSRGERIDLVSFCQQRNLEPRIVCALAEYLCWFGYLQAEDGFYSATPAGANALARWPGAMLYYSYYPLLTELFALARKEKDYGYGKEVYREMYFDTKASGLISERGDIFGPVIDYLKREKYQCLLDLGCGDGTFLAYACEKFPEIRVVGVDQSEIALEAAIKNFRQQGLLDRSAFLQGDLLKPGEFMDAEAVGTVDIATIFFILHEIAFDGLDRVETFLQCFREALPHVHLAITEQYRLNQQEMQPYLHFGYPEFVTLHELSKQRLLRREQWFELAEGAGYQVVDVLETGRFPGYPPSLGTLVLASR